MLRRLFRRVEQRAHFGFREFPVVDPEVDPIRLPLRAGQRGGPLHLAARTDRHAGERHFPVGAEGSDHQILRAANRGKRRRPNQHPREKTRRCLYGPRILLCTANVTYHRRETRGLAYDGCRLLAVLLLHRMSALILSSQT